MRQSSQDKSVCFSIAISSPTALALASLLWQRDGGTAGSKWLQGCGRNIAWQGGSCLSRGCDVIFRRLYLHVFARPPSDEHRFPIGGVVYSGRVVPWSYHVPDQPTSARGRARRAARGWQTGEQFSTGGKEALKITALIVIACQQRLQRSAHCAPSADRLFWANRRLET